MLAWTIPNNAPCRLGRFGIQDLKFETGFSAKMPIRNPNSPDYKSDKKSCIHSTAFCNSSETIFFSTALPQRAVISNFLASTPASPGAHSSKNHHEPKAARSPSGNFPAEKLFYRRRDASETPPSSF